MAQHYLSKVRPIFSISLLVASALSFASERAAIAVPEPMAADIAATVLESGGNAVDAAVAAAFALAVTFPEAGNIGGGGFMTLHINGENRFLDYRETAPASATENMYLDEQGRVIGEDSLVGPRASGVPGTVAGMAAVHQQYGKLTWADLISPAIKLAEDGFVPAPWFVDSIKLKLEELQGRTNFTEYYAHASTNAVFRQPELARTLTRIAKLGAQDFYRGETAALIVEQMQNGGEISDSDLGDYQPLWRTPIVEFWRGEEIVAAPLPSSGGFAIIQYLRMRDLLDKETDGLDHNSAQYIHLKAELEKRIFADRAIYLGDPDFIPFDIRQLLTPDYLKSRIADVNSEVPSPTEDVKPGLEPQHTTHFSILDFDGNAVANTYTLNTDFGSGVVVEGAGFLLNNEMDDFALAPGIPNTYGVVGDKANAIAAGKRMLSSMSPTIILRDGDPVLVVGAMGGSAIFTTVYQTISNLYDYAMTAEQAVAAPRVHHQLLPEDLITYSPTTPIAPEVIDELEELGYVVKPHSYEYGNVQLIWKPKEGEIKAVSDPRFAGKSRVLQRD